MPFVPRGALGLRHANGLRGLVDLVSGQHPPFLFGFPVGATVPVFSFVSTKRDELEPALAYLAANRYHGLTAADVVAVMSGLKIPAPRAVALMFDHARASLWTIAYPLLKQYGLRAIAYAIPGRVDDAPAVRKSLDDDPGDPMVADAGSQPFATWPELREMVSSGWVDVQSNSWSHSLIFRNGHRVDIVRPDREPESVLERARMSLGDPPTFVGPEQLGYPLFAVASRLSDVRQYLPDPEGLGRVEAFVAERGGRAFFNSPSWQRELMPRLRSIRGRHETETERRQAIEHELVAAKDTLESRLGSPVRHLSMPWGVCGRIAAELAPKVGYESVVVDRWIGPYAARPGTDPFRLKRLPAQHVFALPGEGRRAFRTLLPTTRGVTATR